MNIALLIPALQPDGALVQIVRDCRAPGFEHIMAVDDGSGNEFRDRREDDA